MERLDKLLSLHNICSRRQAAALTRAGQVRLNGVAVRRADIHVDTARDTLEVNGKPLLLQQHLYIMMHKPAGVLSASRDPHGKTVVDLLPPELQAPGAVSRRKTGQGHRGPAHPHRRRRLCPPYAGAEKARGKMV